MKKIYILVSMAMIFSLGACTQLTASGTVTVVNGTPEMATVSGVNESNSVVPSTQHRSFTYTGARVISASAGTVNQSVFASGGAIQIYLH